MRLFTLCLLLWALKARAQEIVFPKSVTVTDSLGNTMAHHAQVHVQKISRTSYYCTATIPSDNSKAMAVIDIPLTIAGEWRNKFHWLPNIKMGDNQVVAQHVFRSPCIIQTMRNKSIVLIPDVKVLGANAPTPHYLDLTYTDTSVVLHYGVAHTTVAGHVYYEKTNEPLALTRPLTLAFWLLVLKTADSHAVLKMTNRFLWDSMARPYTKSALPKVMPFAHYADTGYAMALQRYWVDVNDSMGGITLSTLQHADGHYGGRYFKNDLWFQSWFNNMRTAYGMYAWGKELQREEWKKKAMKVVKLLLSAPRNNGWFATVYAPQENKWLASGSPGFARQGSYYLPDNCWTAYWLLRFTKELNELDGADELLLGLGEALIKVQNEDGSFPAGIRATDLQADSTLDHGASSAIATWYLEELLLAGKVPAASVQRYREAIGRSLDFLRKNILPQQRFEDFESFFSCSPKPIHYYDSSTAMYSQNTLSMQWCAEAFLQAYKLFGNKKDIRDAEYCLNILSLYQQVWNPPFISFYAFGGFGAQNTDGEWSDARQAQFAETYYRFYKVTNNRQYLERAIAACRASFALMVLPENKRIAPNNYQGTKRNGEQWSGNMAENYGHHGTDERSYQSGFHWGTGSALTTAAILGTIVDSNGLANGACP